ncbi:alpha/beta hydrolase family protein [Nocardia sp. JMUB6875]|uniref:alpha/beta hydrolase n=1 Tax=Nocardia sp. JMUB6875 TaxID=3158170 RepID=UPI0032E67E86
MISKAWRPVLFALSATVFTLALGFAPAEFDAHAAEGPHIVSTTAAAPPSDPVPAGSTVWSVYSAAMDREVPILVQLPADRSAPRPTLYLLNGAGGGEDTASWHLKSGALEFLSTKNVNVVEVLGGFASYYTDWREPDPVLGTNLWRTFLTAELPPLIDAALGTTGVNAIAGLSTSGTSVLQLAVARPDLYRGVAAYSGCAQISDPMGMGFVNLSIWWATGGATDATHMYGPPGDPLWADNDPVLHADRLRGVNLYVSTGSGLPGQYDLLDDPHGPPGLGGLVNQLVLGGGIEAATNLCTHNLQGRLNELGIPATFDFQPTGTHSWGYWSDELPRSWPVLAAGLGLPLD